MKSKYILMALASVGALNSCANKEPAPYYPTHRTTYAAPIKINDGKDAGPREFNQDLKNYAQRRQVRIGTTYNLAQHAPKMKSQVYAQVPTDITMLPEIHNQGIYATGTNEVKMKLQPIESIPRQGYYPDGNQAYTHDTHIAGGIKTGQDQVKKEPTRKFIHIRHGEEDIKGMARILGIKDKSQEKEARIQLFQEEGEELIYVNKLGFIAIVKQ